VFPGLGFAYLVTCHSEIGAQHYCGVSENSKIEAVQENRETRTAAFEDFKIGCGRGVTGGQDVTI
jgi:hypothetical protein